MAAIRAVARTLRSGCDSVLVGDHPSPRSDFSPSFSAALLLGEGVRPWVTLACRDRNRAALAAECSALAELGVAGVHCVTGDWAGRPPGAEAKVFDLDSLRLIELARDRGLTVSVAEAPAVPPVGQRAQRLAEKVRAGAQMCIINHAGGIEAVRRFVAQAHDAGATVPFVACVPPPGDAGLLARLERLPGVTVEASGARGAATPVTAANFALAMLDVPGIDGVNLSGFASRTSDEASAALMAETGMLIRSTRPELLSADG